MAGTAIVSASQRWSVVPAPIQNDPGLKRDAAMPV